MQDISLSVIEESKDETEYEPVDSYVLMRLRLELENADLTLFNNSQKEDHGKRNTEFARLELSTSVIYEASSEKDFHIAVSVPDIIIQVRNSGLLFPLFVQVV